jgi:hypothetical protein
MCARAHQLCVFAAIVVVVLIAQVPEERAKSGDDLRVRAHQLIHRAHVPTAYGGDDLSRIVQHDGSHSVDINMREGPIVNIS